MIRLSISDNDIKGERGGTQYFIEINEEKVYFRVTDKRSDVHPAAHAAYDIVMAQMISC
ncbi:MAG TPA: hypothetical protein VFM18_18800 [Methanosarcina sp.]|nr:hypothetical protein [Methanosarcina sp.]